MFKFLWFLLSFEFKYVIDWILGLVSDVFAWEQSAQ